MIPVLTRNAYTNASEPAHVATKLITAPTLKVFSLTQAKAHIKYEIADEDALVLDWVEAATRKVELDTNRALLTQTWDLYLDAFPDERDCIRIPKAPLASVTSVNSTDTNGTETALTSSNYVVDTASEPGRIGLTDTGDWPTDLRAFQPGRIRFVAGYTSVDLIPKDLRHAIALLIGHYAEYRQAVSVEVGHVPQVVPMGYQALIANWIVA